MTARASCIAVAVAIAWQLAACASPACPPAELAELTRAPRFAVLTGDYASSAIALFDADGERITEAWLDSGTRAPRLVTALGGDVAFPTENTPGVLLVLDRYQKDVITRIALPSGRLLEQTRLSTSTDAAFSSNPYDALPDGDGLWIPRFGNNLDSAAPESERGSDLVRIVPGDPRQTDRIDLAPLAPSGFVARPSRVVRAGSRLIVGLARLTQDFLSAGPGAVAVVDPIAHTARALDLAPLTNCGDVVPVQGDASAALVTCIGPTFLDARGADGALARRASAGLALVRVDATGDATVALRMASADTAALPPPSTGTLSLGGARALVPSMGALAGPSGQPEVNDTLVWVDLEAREVRIVATSRAPLGFAGRSALDPRSGLVLVPDRQQGVRRYQLEPDGTLAERDTVDPSPCRALPALDVTLLP